MNILIIDHNKTLHQFHTSKRWIGNFTHSYDFLSATAEQRQVSIEAISKANHGLHTEKQSASIHNSQTLNAMDLCPSEDYGISIIDCAHKKILSLNDYGLIGSVSPIEILNLLRPNYFTADKEKELKNFKYLISQHYLDFEPEVEKIILKRIAHFLTGTLEDQSKERVKHMQLDELLFEKPEAAFLPQKTGWTFKYSSDYDDLKMHKQLFLTLNKNNILLSKEQQGEWNHFVNQKMEELDIDNADAFQRMIDKIKIQKEKKVLEKKIKNISPNKLLPRSHLIKI